jgi:hypothetical protein
MASKWFCDLRGKVLGPMSPQELLEMVRVGDVTPTTPVRKNDSKWFRADTVGGLFESAFRDQSDAWAGTGEDEEYDY